MRPPLTVTIRGARGDEWERVCGTRTFPVIEAALDAVLRRAVARRDDAIIAAYREVFHGAANTRTSHQEKVHAALRFGLLLGSEAKP